MGTPVGKSKSAVPAKLRRQVEAVLGVWNEQVEALVKELDGARNAEEFYDAERAVAKAGRTVSDALVAAVVEHRATTSSHVERARKQVHEQANALGVRLESNGRRPTRLRLLGGRVVSFRTLRLRPEVGPRPGRKRGVGKRGPGGTGVYPALEEIGIVGQSTPALRFEVAREVVGASSFAVARENLEDRGIDLDEKTVLRLTYLVAELALNARMERLPATPETVVAGGEFSGKRVVACVDGGRVRTRVNPKAGRRNKKGFRRYKAPWREPKLLTIYVVDENGRRDRKFKTVIDGTMGDADTVVALLIGYLRLYGVHDAAHLTVAGDGALWIWARAEEIRLALELPTERFAAVVDWYHATEKLTAISKIPDWSEPERKTWLTRTERDLYAGDIDAVVKRIRALAVGAKEEEVNTHVPYFDDNRSRMDYARFRAAGIPIGSGSVESAVRRVVNLRMKGNSIFWLEEHAEAVLHLRSYLKAGRWDELVRSVLRRPAAPALRVAA